jgi:hypothetical protein
MYTSLHLCIILLNWILQFCIPYSELYRCEGAVTPDMRIKRPEVRKEGGGGGGGSHLGWLQSGEKGIK